MSFPKGWLVKGSADGYYANANTKILPYLEETSLNSIYDQDEAWYDQRNQESGSTVIPHVQLPLDRGTKSLPVSAPKILLGNSRNSIFGTTRLRVLQRQHGCLLRRIPTTLTLGITQR